MVWAICVMQLKYLKGVKDLMQILGFNKTMQYLAMANIVHWYGHALRRKGGQVLIRALEYELEDWGQKGRPQRTW